MNTIKRNSIATSVGSDDDRETILEPGMKSCALCCEDLPASEFHSIRFCGCSFCRPCLNTYITMAIKENMIAPNITCPDSKCPKADNYVTSIGVSAKRLSVSALGLSWQAPANLISGQEVAMLVDGDTLALFRKLKLEYEVDRDPYRAWCPTPNCDTICVITRKSNSRVSLASLASKSASVRQARFAAGPSTSVSLQTIDKRPQSVFCHKCEKTFCSDCRQEWHPGRICTGSADDLIAWLGSQPAGAGDKAPEIKRCPRCSVWIERDEGCAQMMCRKCKHVFCWFCLQSLEDDFLLRHYDRGPCKNKLGHTRTSVLWHRTQVIGIFAGFGILLLLASPLFLLAAPCVLCCNCCSSPCKFLEGDDEDEMDNNEATPL